MIEPIVDVEGWAALQQAKLTVLIRSAVLSPNETAHALLAAEFTVDELRALIAEAVVSAHLGGRRDVIGRVTWLMPAVVAMQRRRDLREVLGAEHVELRGILWAVATAWSGHPRQLPTREPRPRPVPRGDDHDAGDVDIERLTSDALAHLQRLRSMSVLERIEALGALPEARAREVLAVALVTACVERPDLLADAVQFAGRSRLNTAGLIFALLAAGDAREPERADE